MRINWYFLRSILLWALIAWQIACGVRSDSSPSNLVRTPIPTKQSLQEIEDLPLGQTPTYQGITPGISLKGDVLSWRGEPNVVRTYNEYESLHYFGDFTNPTEEYFLIKDDVVQAVTSNDRRSWLGYRNHPATLADLTEVLSNSEVLTPTFGYSTLVFPSHGIAVSKGVTPYMYQYFVPVSLDEYESLWGEFPLGYDPFPVIPSLEMVGIKPGQTTREQVAQLLGNPDRVLSEDHGTPWLYYVEPDMLGQFRVFFTPDGIVEHMTISRLYSVPHPPLLGDVVQRYGPPDLLQLIPGFESKEYETLALLYLDRGLQVSTRCITPTCEIVRRDLIVGQKTYFQSQTLAEYQATFPNPNAIYIEWHGFDE